MGFHAGHVPEFLKAPILLAAILLAYALTNLVLEEARNADTAKAAKADRKPE
ncbi:hypothetical protein [Chelativorans sp. M5D2P16]|uniref:hypothetical protein n=1 Tax=Chelativorans sp. M5D2P16 TaxID=3095678 RepID=UPI002ACA30BA|nr:hypothetical protein [Chelativorans sp. M5D2P16]MDZ5699570.1 hypothetical protein [Chelativorans sp. M5D2P16]